MAQLKIRENTQYEEVINGSTFIGMVQEIRSEEEFHAFLAEQRELHPDATHHCTAYRLGEVMRFSDDGEPGGTAGRPMLEVILKRNIDFVGAIVIRYYGGKKLGAGGLVRAYSGITAKTLDQAGTEEIIEYANPTIHAPFQFGDVLLRHVQSFPGVTYVGIDYDQHGPIISVTLPAESTAELAALVTELTAGQGELKH